MDSGLVTSDTATAPTATTTATGTAATARPHFGPRLAARVRPRARVARQISQRSTIGVVARSSMGFGLAIGMSQGSRPMVTPDTSTSTRLRPPVPIWRRHDDESASLPAPSPSWAERITRAARPARSGAAPSVHRSSQIAPAPTEFVSSGDRKLDALRRLIQSGPTDEATRTNAAPAAAAASNELAIRRSTAAPTSATERAVLRRGDTVGGPGTAPGEIGRRFQPQSTASSDIKAVLPDAPSSDRSSRPVERRPANLDRGSDRGTDAFQRMLHARGLISSAPGDEPGARPERRPFGGADRSAPDRPAPSHGSPGLAKSIREAASTATPQSGSRAAPNVRRSVERAAPPRRSPDTTSPDTTSADTPAGARLRPQTAAPPPRPITQRGTDGGSGVESGLALVPDRGQSSDLSANVDQQQLIRRESIATAARPISIAEALPTAERLQPPRRHGETSGLRTDGQIDRPLDRPLDQAVAPPPGGTLRNASDASDSTLTDSIDARVEHRPRLQRTRVGGLRSAPGQALANLATRSGLPHTQSDHRRPVTALTRSIDLPGAATVRSHGAPQISIPTPSDISAVAGARAHVVPSGSGPANQRSAARPNDIRRRDGSSSASIARSLSDSGASTAEIPDLDRALVRPTLAPTDSGSRIQNSPLIDAAGIARQIDARDDRTSRTDRAPAPDAAATVVGRRRHDPHLDNARSHNPYHVADPGRGDADRRQLARPGRMGRITGDDHAPVGLQRHSVVGPGPGALQRALADMTRPDIQRHAPGNTDRRSPAPAATPTPTRRSRSNPAAARRTAAPTAAGTAGPGVFGLAPEPTALDGSPSNRRVDATSPDIAPVRTPGPDIARMPAAPPAAPPSPSTSAAPAHGRSATTPRSVEASAVSANSAAGRVVRGSGDVTRAPEPGRPRAATDTDRTIRRHADLAHTGGDRAASVAEVTEAPAPPSASLGDRFLRELSRQPAARPQPLPDAYRPMAQAITGHHRVMLSVNDASRRALRSVGKVAATTDNVIHLDRALAPGRQASQVMAHELTHVAHPSPAPRFFDDDDHSPEERRAEQVARVMAQAPLAPSGTISRGRGAASAPSISRSKSGSTDDVVRRSPARGSGPGVLSAAALADQMLGGPSALRKPESDIVRRAPSSEQTTIQRLSEGTQSSFENSTIDDFSPGQGQDDFQDFRDQLDQHFEYLLRRLEKRMVIELERRGGRFWRGV